MNNKILLGIFALLLVLYVGSRLFKGNRQSSFDPLVVSVDTSAVDLIRIHPKASPDGVFSLERQEGKWMAMNDNMEVDAVTSSVQSLLNQLVSIRAKRVVSKSPDKWPDYEVDESAGTRVEVFGQGKPIVDFIVGAFKYDQANQSASSYIRKTDEQSVYVVDGFLSMSFNQQFNNFRDKTILKTTASDLTTIRLLEGAETETFQKVGQSWLFGGMENVDSTQMANYVSGISNVSGFEFVDDFNPSAASPLRKLEIEANNLMSEITITAYPGTEPETPFIIHSTMNPDVYFRSDSAGIYNRLFGKLKALSPVSM